MQLLERCIFHCDFTTSFADFLQPVRMVTKRVGCILHLHLAFTFPECRDPCSLSTPLQASQVTACSKVESEAGPQASKGQEIACFSIPPLERQSASK